MAAGAVVLVAAGYALQREVNRDRYAAGDATYAWIDRHRSGHTIGLAGSWNFTGISPGWPMFGSRLGNRVFYVGRLHDGQLTQYHSRDQWLDALRRGRYDLVEIARNPPPPATSGGEPLWAAQAGLPVVSESPRFELVRTPGRIL
jgi:hypothetical protein